MQNTYFGYNFYANDMKQYWINGTNMNFYIKLADLFNLILISNDFYIIMRYQFIAKFLSKLF